MTHRYFHFLLLILSITLLPLSKIEALPAYTAESGRLCDNCHSNPYKTSTTDEWKNPELSKRKCTLSCATCHINPSGAGLRSVVGRYYAINTLPANLAENRPEYEKPRSLYALIAGIINKRKNKNITKVDENKTLSQEPTKLQTDFESTKLFLTKDTKKNQTVDKNGNPTQTSDNNDNTTDTDPSVKGFYSLDFLSFYAPLNATKLSKQSPYAFDRTRYGKLNADPLVMIGVDFRFAGLLGNKKAFFPMQTDIGVAFHPIEHLTFSSTVGIKGRSQGAQSTFTYSDWYVIQNAYVLIHELPYQTYVQAGIFLPDFGTRFEDHTLYTRSKFEVQPGSFDRKNLVYGVQVGLAPNYPYLSVSWFSLMDDKLKPTLSSTGKGQGYSVNLGIRDLGWGVGASLIQKFRDNIDGGNLLAVNGNAYYGLWHLVEKITKKTSLRYYLPITLQWDYSVGYKPSDLTVRTSDNKFFGAYTFYLNYLLVNGFSVHFVHTFYDDSFRYKGDSITKIGGGFDYTIIRSIKLSLEYKRVVQGPVADEVILFIRGYL